MPSEEDIAATKSGTSAAPIGQPRNVQDLVLPGSGSAPSAAAAMIGAASAPATSLAAAPMAVSGGASLVSANAAAETPDNRALRR